jgi:endonuclease/exonuclease/phosphatase family metal-dependent hydrolase
VLKKIHLSWLMATVVMVLYSCAEPVPSDLATGPQIPAIDGESSVSVITWNLKYFPQQSNRSEDRVRLIMDSLDADFYCVQEIFDRPSFDDVVDGLDRYDVIYSNHDYLALAIVYKHASFLPAQITHLFENDDDNFAGRAPLFVSFLYEQNGKNQIINLINLHMKCCEEKPSDLQRRHDASNMMHDWMTTAMAWGDSNFVVVGDWNDDIYDPDGSGAYAFEALLDDPDNFEFITDSLAATRTAANASYPSWPSFLDNMLVSRSLFDEARQGLVRTLRLDEVFGDYTTVVSDHRPVLWRFVPN